MPRDNYSRTSDWRLSQMTHLERRHIWQERVERCRASGTIIAAWCRENEVSEHQMYYWLRKIRSEDSDQVASEVHWIQMGQWDLPNDMRPAEDDSVLIHIGRAMVEVRPGFNPTLLRDIVKALSAP